MAEINIDSLQNFCDKLKTELVPRTYIKPDLLLEFDIDSIYIWYLLPSITLYLAKWDLSIYIHFLCFKLRIRLCPNIFKYNSYNCIRIPILPYIVYQRYQRDEFPNQIEVVFYKWFYRYSFGGIKPKEITKYYRTKKFIKSFDD